MDFTAMFGYGDMVQDEYSGFTGKVVAVCFYKTGCTQYCVHPGKLKEDGTILSGEWLDETRLKPVEPMAIRNKEAKGKTVVMSIAELEQEVQVLVARELQRQQRDLSHDLKIEAASGGPQRNAPAVN